MKKIMMILLSLIFLFNAKDVFAQDQYNLSFEKQEGIYFSRHGVNFDDDSNLFYVYKFGSIYAYCIEPGKHISTYTYIGTSEYVDLPFSEDVKEKLELIGYYGRDYPGHNNIRYSMAAQALIWELTGVDIVTFWTKINEQGQEIDISKEKNEIMNLVNNHKTVPNFKTNYSASLKKEIMIYDTNKVLDDFEIESNGGQDVYIKNNTLHIVPKKVGTSKITLKRKNYDFYKTIIFVGKEDGSSQKMARFRYSKEIKKEVSVNVEGIHLLIQKVDENNNPIKLSNIKFKIKNNIYQTDSEGRFLTEAFDYGEYEIEELEDQIIPGYSWNSNKVKVNLNQDTTFNYNDERHNYLEINFKNNSVPGSVEITKKGEKLIYTNNGISFQDVPLANIYFDLYTVDNQFIKTVITDANGYVKVDNLKVGTYYLIEKTKIASYIEKGKISFKIQQDNQYQTSINAKLTIRNELKKGKLEFSKLDFDTKKGIANTIIEIYDEHNNLLYTKETDSSGKIIIDNLPIGKYYIKEKQANYYYEKTDEIVNFEIKEHNEIVKKELTNKKLLGKVELTKFGEEFIISNNNPGYTSKPLANIEFNLYDENNRLIDTLKTNENGYLSKELELGKYYFEEKTKLSNYKDNSEKYYFEIKKENDKAVNIKLNVNNYLKKGGVEFRKEDKISLFGISNTIMEVYNDKDELLLTKVTDNDGKIVINNLPLGNYYFKENEANFFFKITDEIVPFEIKDDGEIVKTKLTNEKIVGDLEIYKVGENYHFINNEIVYDNESLYGIVFDLYDSTDKLIGSIRTDKNGYAKYTNLPIGKYYVIEKTNLDKYINDNKYYFEIKKKSGTEAYDTKLEIVNKLKKGNLEFSKTDFVTSEGIPNTIIEIYNDKDMLIFTKETDSNGKVIIKDLPIGKYYIIEKEANYNYEKTDEKVFFEIKENGSIVKANMTNKKILGNLEINKNGEKYQIVNGEMVYEKIKLSGIEFNLYDSTDKLIDTLKTDENGYIKKNELPLGKYYLIEKNNYDNYILNNDKIDFEIKKDGNKAIDVKLTIDNYLKKGILEFSKTDFVTSEGIPNTIVEIYDENNNLWFTKETDLNGRVIINNLPVGKYYIIEKEANSLYMITNEKVFFEIKENGEIVKANMTNERIEVPVPKTSTSEYLMITLLTSIGLFIGIGGCYERKEAY